MGVASVAPTYFMPMLPSTFSSKPTCCQGKNYKSAVVSMVSDKQELKTSKNMPYHDCHPLKLETPRRIDGVHEMFGGKVSEDHRVFKQNFAVRSYDLGPGGKATMEFLMNSNRLQEIQLQHSRSFGLSVSGFSSTPELQKRNLVWVYRKLQIDVDKYPSWGDIIQIETWSNAAAADRGMFRDYVIRDCRSGEISARATSLHVMMNMKTRRFARVIPDIRDETKHLFTVGAPLIDIEKTKLWQWDANANNYVQQWFSPSWSDIDMNLHVNHIKYLKWIIQGIPVSVLKNHDLSSLLLEFRSESKMGDMLQSLTSASSRSDDDEEKGIGFDHLLRTEDGTTILRGKAAWKPRGDDGEVEVSCTH